METVCSNGLRIMIIFFQDREVHKYTWYRSSMDQKSLIDFCIVSSDLFSDVLDVRVKRGAELSTDHHLVVCSLRLSKPWPNRKSNRSSETHRIKWKALEDKEVRKQFASSISSKFRRLLDLSDDIEKEWLLFRSAIISSATESCRWKRLRVAGGSEKRTPWWKKEIKKAIRAKKDAFEADPAPLGGISGPCPPNWLLLPPKRKLCPPKQGLCPEEINRLGASGAQI